MRVPTASHFDAEFEVQQPAVLVEVPFLEVLLDVSHSTLQTKHQSRFVATILAEDAEASEVARSDIS